MLTSLKVSWLTSQTQKSPPTYCRYQGSRPGRKVVSLVSHSLPGSSRALPGPWRHTASETGVEEACKPEQRHVVGTGLMTPLSISRLSGFSRFSRPGLGPGDAAPQPGITSLAIVGTKQ